MKLRSQVEVLRNHMMYSEFLKEDAVYTITTFMACLPEDVTSEEFDELLKIANEKGLDVMPDDYGTRLDKQQKQIDNINSAIVGIGTPAEVPTDNKTI